MARRNGSGQTIEADEPVALEPVVRAVTREIRTALVEAPIGELGPGYVSRYVEARFDERQSNALKGLVSGLRDSREMMANGREVKTNADAIKWLLEKLSESD